MTRLSSVELFLSQDRLALAGISRSGKKFGNTIFKDLTTKGYDIALVHPEAKELEGHKCYPTLAEVPGQVGGLLLVVPPDQTENLVQEAVQSGIRNIWMQQGSESPEAVEFCHNNGINIVHGECILMFAKPNGVHKFHRWIWGLLGKLPTA